MKPWVMAWLWFLNLVYLSALFWLDHPEARYTLVAYVAVFPIAVAIVIPQRGLTRLSGLMHFPFLILILWLAPRVFTSWPVDLFNAWIILLFSTTAICIVFDIVDIFRWCRVERYRFGTPEAVRWNASKAAISHQP